MSPPWDRAARSSLMLNASPTAIAVLLCIVSVASIHVYLLLRRLQVSVGISGLPSVSWIYISVLWQIPGFKPLVSPLSTFGAVLPRIPSLIPGITWQWDERETGMYLFQCSGRVGLCSRLSLFQPLARCSFVCSSAHWRTMFLYLFAWCHASSPW